MFRPMLVAAALALMAAAPLQAEEIRDSAVFDFYIHGFRAGILVFNGVQSGDYYAVNGRFSTAGVVSLVRSVRYDASVTGQVVAGKYQPQTYELTSQPGSKTTVQTITYVGGVPQAPVQDPPRAAPDPLALDPATQAGTLDTLTAIYATFRAIPEQQACNGTLELFDGVRRAELKLWPADGPAGTLACNGEYRRVAGYSQQDMERPSFPFRMTYEPADKGLVQVARIDMDSIYGNASLKRR